MDWHQNDSTYEMLKGIHISFWLSLCTQYICCTFCAKLLFVDRQGTLVVLLWFTHDNLHQKYPLTELLHACRVGCKAQHIQTPAVKKLSTCSKTRIAKRPEKARRSSISILLPESKLLPRRHCPVCPDWRTTRRGTPAPYHVSEERELSSNSFIS